MAAAFFGAYGTTAKESINHNRSPYQATSYDDCFHERDGLEGFRYRAMEAQTACSNRSSPTPIASLGGIGSFSESADLEKRRLIEVNR